jgi:transposase
MDELPDLSSLSHEEKDSLIRMLFPLIEKVRQLTVRVEELEARLSKDSHNSSKPPSSDGLSKKTRSLRVASGKKPGGQAGRTGKTLERAQHVDVVIDHALPEHCQECGASLVGADAQLDERRQVFDIPVARYQVLEHRTWQLRCACGQLHQSQFPEDVTELVQYGPNVRALAVHLSAGQMLPLGRSAQLIAQLFGLTVSPATVLAWIDQASGLLHPEVARIAQALIDAPVAHADESGLRVASRLHWLHTVASDTHTWYGVHAKRGMLAIAAHGILPKRMATLVHDCWKPYWQLDCEHALCNAHLLRELTFLHETTCQRWPKRMIGLLLAARDRCEAARADERTALSARQIQRIFTHYDAILVKAQASHPQAVRHRKRRGRVKQTPAFNLIRRMREHATEVLRFVTDLQVPFTNNLGERAIRMPKVKQKVSGCFRTLKGAQNFCTIRSYLDTMHKQGYNLFEVLRHTFIGCPPSPVSV